MWQIPNRFELIVHKLRNLERFDEYEGAFIFGSVARGNAREDSDLDVHVITQTDNEPLNVIHFNTGGIDVDLTFLSRTQLLSRSKEEISKNRLPMVSDSLILFEKNSSITSIKKRLKRLHRRQSTQSVDRDKLIIEISYHKETVERQIDENPASSLLLMHLAISDILKAHYRIQGRCWPGGKRLFADVENWDRILANKLNRYVAEATPRKKYHQLCKLIQYIVEPMKRYEQTIEQPSWSAITMKGMQRLLN